MKKASVKVSVYIAIFFLCTMLLPKKILSKEQPGKNNRKEETSNPKEKKRSLIMDIMFKRARKFDKRMKKLVKNIKKEIKGEDQQKEKKTKTPAHSHPQKPTQTNTQETFEQDPPKAQDDNNNNNIKKETKAKTKVKGGGVTGKLKKMCTVVKKTGKIIYLIARELIRM